MTSTLTASQTTLEAVLMRRRSQHQWNIHSRHSQTVNVCVLDYIEWQSSTQTRVTASNHSPDVSIAIVFSFALHVHASTLFALSKYGIHLLLWVYQTLCGGTLWMCRMTNCSLHMHFYVILLLYYCLLCTVYFCVYFYCINTAASA